MLAQLDHRPDDRAANLGRAVALLVAWGRERRARLAAEQRTDQDAPSQSDAEPTHQHRELSLDHANT